jgi:hypothetical protein
MSANDPNQTSASIVALHTNLAQPGAAFRTLTVENWRYHAGDTNPALFWSRQS